MKYNIKWIKLPSGEWIPKIKKEEVPGVGGSIFTITINEKWFPGDSLL